MGWLIALGVLTLLAIMPIGVSFRYDGDGPLVRVLFGAFGVTVYPSEKTKSKKEAPEKPSKDNKSSMKTAKTPEKKGGKIQDFMPLVRTALDFLGDFRRKIRVRRLDLNVILAGGDPCDLGVNYGRAWAALGNLWPQLERLFVIKKRNVEIQCDFEASQTLVTACLEVTITLGRLLALVVIYGLRGIKEFMKLQKLRKGGTVK